MEQEIAYLERAVARRDRVIEKLHIELEEKDAISFIFFVFVLFSKLYFLTCALASLSSI